MFGVEKDKPGGREKRNIIAILGNGNAEEIGKILPKQGRR